MIFLLFSYKPSIIKQNMKKRNLMIFFLGLLFCISCQDNEMTLVDDVLDCGSSPKILKKVKNQEGRLLYSEAEKRYIIVVTIPNTIDSQDVGVICNPPHGIDISNLDGNGITVIFDGKYKEYDTMPVQMFVGQIYYYLSINKIKVQQD